MGDQVNCCAVKYGLDSGIAVMNGLIDMYVNLIVGYAQFGLGQEALNLFRRMKKHGIKPNQVTFVGVLIACSHVGLVDEGIQLLKSMEHEHGVIPTREHISCVVDLLARAGRIHDAEVFIDQLGFEPDVMTWKTLLAACKNCGNVEVGRRVAEKILRVDPSNPAAHVLLCNIHASAGNWKDVACLRASMREKGIKKLRGQIWIKVKDQIHVFTAKDGLHQEKDVIFLTLDELLLQISEVFLVKVGRRRVVLNFRKADAALAQLENREVKVEKKEEDDEEKECEEEEEEITEEDFLNKYNS
ncbi:pentatricopeptide repeat-containing protein At3g53360, mitochondrial-like [Salvia splendens]|uniref:pentatricopeptide repeat-containing protein At3g53360, mitochondrial-like n=1 Tax=Salvia splendens TaxID=180675 RepID=UPI001C264237|nr:pentatricopeptide repeat-containing protein At3g53360, mitochondrial-like [Salvia splendens]